MQKKERKKSFENLKRVEQLMAYSKRRNFSAIPTVNDLAEFVKKYDGKERPLTPKNIAYCNIFNTKEKEEIVEKTSEERVAEL